MTARLNKRRRELGLAAGSISGYMKGSVLSTEQSITTTRLSDNGRLSRDNTNDTVNSKATYTDVGMNRFRSNASEFFSINQNEKEVSSRINTFWSALKASVRIEFVLVVESNRSYYTYTIKITHIF